MMQLEKEKMTDEKSQSEPIETKQYFITNEKFELLRQYQQSIFESMEVSPALRKIVNELITVENLEKVKAKFINAWSNE